MSGISKETSRKGSVIYEEVLQKNFEIIETFLKKFHQIFIRQDQFEEHLNRFGESNLDYILEFLEYDENLEELREEQRLSLVMLEKKVNNMKISTKDSHRSSHRWSKAGIPIFEANDTLESGKNYTMLRFNSIEELPFKEETLISSVQRKETLESVAFSTKEYDEIKQSMDSMKVEITQMKDKLNFLSVYTSSIDSQEATKIKLSSMKKEIIQTLEANFNQKIEKDLRNQMMETENIFLQHINNLTFKSSEELVSEISKKTEIFNSELKKINQNIFTKKEAEKLESEINKNMKEIADESIKNFVEKEEFRNYLNYLNKKIKSIENQNKISLEKTEKDKEHFEYFNSLIQVNSTNAKSTPFLEKMSKSQSQWIKNKSQNFSITEEEIKDKNKENLLKKSSLNESVEDLSKGSLLASQVSKEFMKNFGIKQKKLIKGNFLSSKKSSLHMSQIEADKKLILRPETVSP